MRLEPECRWGTIDYLESAGSNSSSNKSYLIRFFEDGTNNVRARMIDLRSRAHEARRLVIEMAYRAKKGHIGSALSIIEIATVIASKVFDFQGDRVDRPRFVLSKGHAATAWYAAAAACEVIDKSEVLTYGSNGSRFGTHPDPVQPGTDFMTGSLGQGVGFAVGSALASRLSGTNFRVYCILSDSELNEGSTWESLHIASQLKLDRLTVVLDLNGQQALGMTHDVMNVGNVGIHFKSVGWNVIEIDGHNVDEILGALEVAQDSTQPVLIIASTVAGYPVDFMMKRVEWHYLPLTETQYNDALMQIDEIFAKGLAH